MKKITIITLFMFISINIKAQILTETFESDSFPPNGWITLENCEDSDDASDIEWIQQDDYEDAYHTYGWAHTGNYSAMSSFGFMDTYEAWLVTPQFTPTNEHHILHFFYKQAYADNYDGNFQIRVSTSSQDQISDFTTLETIDEETAPLNFEEHTVDLSAYVGQAIYIAFINYDDDGDGDEWYIDDVTMEPVEVPGPTQNPTPADNAENVQITNTQTSRINLSWEAPTTGGYVLQYDFWLGTEPDHLKILGHPSNLEAHPKTFHFNHTYYWKASAVNISGESSSIWSFTTCDFPTVVAPYSINFENEGYIPDGMDQSAENGHKFWHFVNSLTATSHIGNAGDASGTETESGGYFAFVLDAGEPSPNGTKMYSPKIDISSLITPAISFYILSNNEGDVNVNFEVQAFDGTNWISIFTNSENTNGWEKKVVDLSSYNLPSTTQFCFVVNEPDRSLNNDDFAIDDIKIDELNALGTSEFNMSNIKIYPNPVKKDLYITMPDNDIISTIKIYNVKGQLILQAKNTNYVDVSNLPKGNYIIKVVDQKNNSIIQKFIK